MDKALIIKDGNLLVDDAFMFLKKLEQEALRLKNEESILAVQRKNLEAKAAQGKEIIKNYLVENGLAEIGGDVVKYTLSKSQPKLIIDDESLIPREYKEETITVSIRKDAIKDQLKMGDEIPGCHLEDSWALKVGVNS